MTVLDSLSAKKDNFCKNNETEQAITLKKLFV